MPPRFSPIVSDQILPLIRERFRRSGGDPGLGEALAAKAQARFGIPAGWTEPLGEVTERMLAAIRAGSPRVDHVILVPHRDLWRVVDEPSLAEVLPPETTVRLYFGPRGRMEPSPRYPTFDVEQCLPLVLGLLEALSPRSVYVRGSAQFKTELLGAAVKARFPGLFTVFEVYDYACMFDDVFLDTWGYTPELAEESRDAEVYLALNAGLVIDKTPGAQWQEAAEALFRAPRRSYCPELGTAFLDAAPPAPRDPGATRLLCAGSMPHFHNYRPGAGFPHWAYQNIIDPIVRLSREPDFRVDIFNASHDPALDHWPAFGEYATLFDPERVAYHARIPLSEIHARLPRYDFGIFYFAASSVTIDYPLQQCLPNRCMSYIAGDLPLIVNTEMTHLASLVERFQAGIALPSTDQDELPRRIRAAGAASMRAGAAALRRHLVEANAATLGTFRELLGGIH